MPHFDFVCVNGHVREDVWVSMFRDALNAPIAPCEQCGEPLTKRPAAPNFSIKGYNAQNGYSK